MKVTFLIGEEQESVELNAGERLLKAAYKLGLDAAGFGDCGGNCICSTCHVYVEQGEELFDEPNMEEEMRLDIVPDPQENSRLACQLIASNDGEVVVRVPERIA